jgi:hypothetical protein
MLVTLRRPKREIAAAQHLTGYAQAKAQKISPTGYYGIDLSTGANSSNRFGRRAEKATNVALCRKPITRPSA